MPQKSERVLELESAILDAVEVIDQTDQSRKSLSDGMDETRNILAAAYGEDFEYGVAERLGIELISDEELEDIDLSEEDEDI